MPDEWPGCWWPHHFFIESWHTSRRGGVEWGLVWGQGLGSTGSVSMGLSHAGKFNTLLWEGDPICTLLLSSQKRQWHGQPRRWWSHHLWRSSRTAEMWHWGMQLVGNTGGRWMIRLEILDTFSDLYDATILQTQHSCTTEGLFWWGFLFAFILVLFF